MSDGQWMAIGRLEDIPPRGARCVVSPLGRIAVFRTADDQVYATEDRCPHRGGPLSQGIVHGSSVSCPLHNRIIALDSGLVQGPDVGAVRTFPIRISQAGELEMLIDIAHALAEAAE
jgi:nitrite reductase (NADH) small subunit